MCWKVCTLLGDVNDRETRNLINLNQSLSFIQYRASSPTIMTTRGKRHKSDPNKETVDATSSPDKDKDSSSSTSVSHRGDSPRSKKNGMSCVVPGCQVTGWSNPDVKWYKFPKVNGIKLSGCFVLFFSHSF